MEQPIVIGPCRLHSPSTINQSTQDQQCPRPDTVRP
jgi:hypothetical protein